MTDLMIISYLNALEIIRLKAHSKKLAFEQVDLENAIGRVIAKDLFSSEDLPSFDNSAMDGFAVKSAITAGASKESPLRLPVLGSLAAGDSLSDSNALGTWEIMTGAPFPTGYDACVRLEDVKILRDENQQPVAIEILEPAKPSQNRREIGEDFKNKSLVLPAGHRLRSEDLLALTSLGFQKISVVKKPRVGVISTGKELIPASEKPSLGKIRNSTGPYLMVFLKSHHIDAVHLGTVYDEPQQFKDILHKTKSENFDLILTTGAVSMGKYDFIAKALKEINAEIFFQKVAMRPGKPILFGQLSGGTFILGLPGNPISSAVGLRFFALPFLRALQNEQGEAPLRLPLAEATRKAAGASSFLKGHVVWKKSGSEILLHKAQRPSLMHALIQSEVWIHLPEEGEEIPARHMVDVYNY